MKIFSLKCKSIIRSFLIADILITCSLISAGQIVLTLPIKGLNGPNGFAISRTGELYIANEPGKNVVVVSSDSSTNIILEADSPSGLDFDKKGNLFVSNFFSGIIMRLIGQHADTFFRAAERPADIKFDSKENLYVSEYEKGTILKIDKYGKAIEFAAGIAKPFGLTFDDEDNLYVASNTTGVIFKINPSGDKQFFAQITGSVSYIAYSKKAKKIFVPSFTGNSIYSVTKGGKVKLLTGTPTPGYKDGAIGIAQYNGPNSIAVSANGDLYISEFSSNRVRKITMPN